MREHKLKIGGTCYLIEISYGEGIKKDVSLDYIEHSTDHWHSDSQTSIDIDELKAREIILFLQKAFEI